MAFLHPGRRHVFAGQSAVAGLGRCHPAGEYGTVWMAAPGRPRGDVGIQTAQEDGDEQDMDVVCTRNPGRGAGGRGLGLGPAPMGVRRCRRHRARRRGKRGERIGVGGHRCRQRRGVGHGRIRDPGLGGTTNIVDAFLPLPGSTNGSLLVRVDYSRWDVGAVDGDEQVSFYLEGAGNVRMELLRFFDGAWDLTAWSPPDIGTVQQFATAISNQVATVLELDIDQLAYRVWWGDGSASGWNSSAWQAANSNLTVDSLRFRKAGDFSQAGDAVEIDRITVADQLADVVDLPPYPENLVAGWMDDTPGGTSTAPGVELRVDVAAGGARFDADYNCSDRYYGSDGNPSYATGPHDVKVSAITLQSNQYAFITITNAYAGPVTLDELRFDWGARFNGSPRFFYVYYDSGNLSGVTDNTLLWSVTTFPQSPSADGNVADYNDADIDLSGLADTTLEVGEYATFRLAVGEFGDAGKSILDNIGFFGSVPPPLVSGLAVDHGAGAGGGHPDRFRHQRHLAGSQRGESGPERELLEQHRHRRLLYPDDGHRQHPHRRRFRVHLRGAHRQLQRSGRPHRTATWPRSLKPTSTRSPSATSESPMPSLTTWPTTR